MIFLLVGSIFLASRAHGSLWPYHGSLSVVPPAIDAIIVPGPVDASIVQPLKINSEPKTATVVAGPSSGATVIKGSMAGPVTVTAGTAKADGVVPVHTVDQDQSQGFVAVVSPTDGSVTVTGELAGASSTAVVGPSSGSVVIAGPNAVPPVAIPSIVPVPGIIGISDASVGVIGSTGDSVLVKGATSGPTVIQEAAAAPVISQEILDNSVLVRQPKIKLPATPTSAVVISPEAARVAISGPTAGKAAIAGPRAASTIVSGPSRTITTSGGNKKNRFYH